MGHPEVGGTSCRIPFHPRGSATSVVNSKESRMKVANATKPRQEIRGDTICENALERLHRRVYAFCSLLCTAIVKPL
jgi:hypothetical protein